MAAKYHISDNGMPGKCTASSPDSCPKTQAGDSFHGTLEEATQEAHTRFERELGAFATSSKAEEDRIAEGEAFAQRFADAASAAIENPTTRNEGIVNDLRRELQAKIRAGEGRAIVDSKIYEDAEIALAEAKSNELGGEVYRHPQGKLIRVNPDGSVQAFKDGKEVSTSATAEKLRAGYGQWKRGDATGLKLPGAPQGEISPEEAQELQDSYARKLTEVRESAADSADLYAEHKAYDAQYAEAEGRLEHYDYKSNSYLKGKHPSGGSTRIVPSAEQKAEREAMNERVKAAAEAERNAQTALEEAGLGHTIPDEEAVPGHSYRKGHTIRVNTQAQKWLLVNELQGQISDGKWENTSGNPWEDWSSAKVIVDPQNPGRNFFTTKDNYQLNAKDLLDVVGDRMIEDVQNRTGNANYSEKDMLKDLADLRKIFKTKRDRIEG